MGEVLETFMATAARIVYWDPVHDVAVAECATTWVPPEERRDAWERLSRPPAPMGFDPAAGEPYASWTPAPAGP